MRLMRLIRSLKYRRQQRLIEKLARRLWGLVDKRLLAETIREHLEILEKITARHKDVSEGEKVILNLKKSSSPLVKQDFDPTLPVGVYWETGASGGVTEDKENKEKE